MNTYLHYVYFFLLLLCGCSSVEEPISMPTSEQPTLHILSPECAMLGVGFDVDCSIAVQGARPCALAVKLLAGQATATLDNASMPLNGEWIDLSEPTCRLCVKPLLLGLLTLSIQAKNAAGLTSEVQRLEIAIVPPTAPPILRLHAPMQGSQGLPLFLDVEVESFTEDHLSLAAVLIEGEATGSLEDVSLSLNGEWIPLKSKTCRVSITPTGIGTLKLSFQARFAAGATSATHLVSIPISASSPIRTEISCEKTIINPVPGTRVPMSLQIDKAGYSDTFLVCATQIRGLGRFFVGETEVTGTAFEMNTSGVVDYVPQVVGAHVVEFAVAAGDVTATATAYIDVYKRIEVRCAAKECITILGAGDHSVEGEQAFFALDDREGYGFQVAGWYTEDGALLTTEPDYTMPIRLDSPNTLELRLRPRVVTISRNPATKRKYRYGYNGEIHLLYVYASSLEASHRVSEPLIFSYEEYSYNFNVLPPAEVLRVATPTIAQGGRFLGKGDAPYYLWRIDNDFRITIRRADNPRLKFHTAEHALESSSTKYILPSDVVFE